MKEGDQLSRLNPTKLRSALVTLICITLFMIWASDMQLFHPAFKPQSMLIQGSADYNFELKRRKCNDTMTRDVVEDRSSKSSEFEGNKACNYAKGRWVADEHRPHYSGANCKKFLSKAWACKLSRRKDFSYEKFRWQPSDCETEEFTGSKFLERMRDKTLAYVGDSLGRQQFQSLMCMILGDKHRSHNVIDVASEYGIKQSPHAVRPDGWAYRFPATNTTVLFYWSACLCELEWLHPLRRKSKVAMHLDRPPSFLLHFLPKFDVLVLNTGHHWNEGKFKANRWVIHIGGKPNLYKDIRKIPNALNFTINNVVKWVDGQASKYPNLKAFYRSISPRHFFNGEWNSGGTCNNTIPLSRGSEVVKDESSDYVAANAVKGTKVKLLDITAMSELRDEGHVSKYGVRRKAGIEDCLHWCLPGIPDAWNEILFAQL